MSDKQHENPCAGCPFSRKAIPGTLGGSPPYVYIGQINGPFWLPCHMDSRYNEETKRDLNLRQCAGAAIFRANLGIDESMPSRLLHLSPDIDKSFQDFAEFLCYHTGMEREDALAILKLRPPNLLTSIEMRKVEAKTIGLS